MLSCNSSIKSAIFTNCFSIILFSEMVEKLEDYVDRCMQDLSTNSNVPTSEKSVILRQLVKMADLINELQDNI